MGLRNCLPSRVRSASSIAALLLALAVPASAQTTNFTRHLGIYYGTWSVFIQGNPNPVTNQVFVELSDHISGGLQQHIQNDATVDGRVKSASPLWVFPPDLTNIEWVIGTPENLSAIASFNASIAALGGSITTDSGFNLAAQQTYLIDMFDVNGVTANFYAEVSYVERNGSVTLSSVGKCPLSHGYWKNNLTLWTVPSLTLGTVSYPKAELAAILNGPGTKDASVILARQLIAAKLNVLYGADATPVATAISQADALLGSSHVPFGVPPNSPLGTSMTDRSRTLAEFNNGQLTTICVP